MRDEAGRRSFLNLLCIITFGICLTGCVYDIPPTAQSIPIQPATASKPQETSLEQLNAGLKDLSTDESLRKIIDMEIDGPWFDEKGTPYFITDNTRKKIFPMLMNAARKQFRLTQEAQILKDDEAAKGVTVKTITESDPNRTITTTTKKPGMGDALMQSAQENVGNEAVRLGDILVGLELISEKPLKGVADGRIIDGAIPVSRILRRTVDLALDRTNNSKKQVGYQ